MLYLFYLFVPLITHEQSIKHYLAQQPAFCAHISQTPVRLQSCRPVEAVNTRQVNKMWWQHAHDRLWFSVHTDATLFVRVTPVTHASLLTMVYSVFSSARYTKIVNSVSEYSMPKISFWRLSLSRRNIIENVWSDDPFCNFWLADRVKYGGMGNKDKRCDVRNEATISTRVGPDSVDGMATSYGLDIPEIVSRRGKIYPHPYRPAELASCKMSTWSQSRG